MNATQIAQAAASAGFSGSALTTIVAIALRESGGNELAQGDITLQDGTWGPSVGLFQIRTLKSATGTGGDRDISALIPGAQAGVTGSGTADVIRQAAAAYTISGGGSDFSPWSTYAGLSDADLSAAQTAIADAGTLPTTAHTVGFVGDTLGGAMDSALGSFLGLPDGETVSEWVIEMAIRGIEVVGGAVIFAGAVLMLLNIIGRAPGDPKGMILRGVAATRKLSEQAAMLVATKGAA